jgi:predicted aconitase with swiveling domain
MGMKRAAMATGTAIIDGRAAGRVLRVDHPLSFWGGVDPATGRISDPRSSLFDTPVAQRVLMLTATVGSSSSSAVMLELLAKNIAPAALVIGNIDAIIGVGVIVAREMGYGAIPVIHLVPSEQAAFDDGAEVEIGDGGVIRSLT